MENFFENRKYIQNEFEMAVFDKSTGLPPDELSAYLRGVQESETDLPRPLVCANAYAYLCN